MPANAAGTPGGATHAARPSNPDTGEPMSKANLNPTTKQVPTSNRRSVLAGIAATPCWVVPPPRLPSPRLIQPSPISSDTEEPKLHSALRFPFRRSLKKAFPKTKQRWWGPKVGEPDAGPVPTDAPEWTAAMHQVERTSTATCRTLIALVSTEPTTIAGCAAVVKYLAALPEDTFTCTFTGEYKRRR